MQGKKAIAWHNLVVEIRHDMPCMRYTRILNIPPAQTMEPMMRSE
jgi:hypothetical protein